MLSQWEKSIQKGASNRFVDSVVAADVFTNNLRVAVQIKDSGSVNATGAGEVSLLLLQSRGEDEQPFHVNPDVGRCNHWKVLANGLDAGLTANPAA